MTTTIMRHGQTLYSVSYLVNGDPSVEVGLSAEGIRTCRRAHDTLPENVDTWIATELPRTRQSACVLAGQLNLGPIIEKGLNELDYGAFEGGTFLDYGAWLHQHGGWTRPPGSSESQREGLQRMLHGLRACLNHPAPRVVVVHGLLVSMLLWHRDHDHHEEMPVFFPEAPHAKPLTITDDALCQWIDQLFDRLEAERVQRLDVAPAPKPMRDTWPLVATFKTTANQPATKDSDHA